MATKIKFWIDDPCILFTDLVFFPVADMTKEQKFNAFTRLAITIAIIMYAMEYKHWLTFLLLALLVIVVAFYASKSPSSDVKENIEGFSIVPTRIDDDFHNTIVAPTFAEEVRIPPPAYDEYSNITELVDPPFEEPLRPQSYPYGQYLTTTNLLPSDEYLIRQNPSGGAKSAREFAGSLYLKNRIAEQENMTRIFKKSLARRFRHNENDTFSPFSSY